MCFIVEKENNKVLINEKDIVCYKYTEKRNGNKYSFFSLFRKYKYVVGLNYKVHDSDLKFGKEYVLHEALNVGFHSYKEIYYYKGSNYHFKELIRDNSIYKCIIPAGSFYMQNLGDEEYISDNIMIVKKLDSFDFFKFKVKKLFLNLRDDLIDWYEFLKSYFVKY